MKRLRLFDWVTDRLVYSQMWEDPVIDREVLELRPHHKVVSIGSAGCNPLTYLLDDPQQVTGVDLNRHQVALAKLKLVALRECPTFEDFFALFGNGRDPANPERYWRLLRHACDDDMRAYWEGRTVGGQRRISLFASGLHQRGAVGLAIGGAHLWAGLNGKDMRRILAADSITAQRRIFDAEISPLFRGRLIGALARLPATLYPLGIPRRQQQEMRDAAGGDILGWLHGIIEDLACAHPIADNWFAWQVFGRGYDLEHRRAIPPYLAAENFARLRQRADRLEFRRDRLADHLLARERGSVHRFVLLDAQDWMDPASLHALWSAIDHAADPADARVLFRTAGSLAQFTRKLGQWPPAGWNCVSADGSALAARDRSSLYAGVHVVHKFGTEMVDPALVVRGC